MKLNRKALNFALELVEKGEWKQTESWEPPTPEEENRYIEKYGFEEYGKWFLGIREDTDEETKQHYAYIFTDDFKKVNRKGVIAIRQRAGQFDEDEIFEAAGKILEAIDKSQEKRVVAYLRKSYDLDSTGDGVYRFVITKEIEDRTGDIVRVNGVRFQNYLKNPVVLFNHDPNLVIGKTENIEVTDSEVVAGVRFSKYDPMASKVKGLLEEGILNAASIGFIPIKKVPLQNGGYDIIEWELLEISIVAIPANPYALLMKYLGSNYTYQSNYYYESKSNNLSLKNDRLDNSFSDLLKSDHGYDQILEELKAIRNKIKQTQGGVKDGNSSSSFR